MNDNVSGFTNTSKINQEAAEWILLVEDTPRLSQKQIDELNVWVATSDVHKQCLTNMANSWGEMDLLSSVMLPLGMKKQSKIALFFANLFMPLIALFSFIMAITKRSFVLFRPAYAFSLTIVCALTWFSIDSLQSSNPPLVFATTVGQQSSHTMADGSLLWLNSSTKVKVDYSEGHRRIHLITGEAHFEVAKDATRPFEVYTDNRLVTAIGTAFTVHKLKDSIEIIVTEGTVELAVINKDLLIVPEDDGAITLANSVNNPQLLNELRNLDEADGNTSGIKRALGKLTAGQRISIPTLTDNLGDVVELDANEVTRHLSWKEGKLVFAGESLEEVIKEITRHTEVKIDIVDAQLKSLRIGGQFQVGETDTLFYVLESGFGIKVNKLNNNHIQLKVKEVTN
ncbi:FecR family protein [Thalassotalea sp. ND16A]|uniref:FecR family protein n=1 Tax=Thalassotalea sp. ND16A TaxID=1535422 RepID=UPI00051A6251|nr:FecR domain-containing protein [Thalassotalea sp. ND16A]KGK00107.1 hypothetical protein ND16A_0298 [Thalassotalea sp. ND16A]